ncbi:MAG: type II secretion system F family protein, partial [Proteobacteria bacterium]|nr:type II secretion system F family protein [Pseudomonadota bacterium]
MSMPLAVVFLGLVFGAALLGMLALLTAAAPREIAARLGSPVAVTPPSGSGEESNSPWAMTISRLTTPFSRLSLPSGQWEDSALRIHFMHAGYRAASAPTAFFAVKSVLTFLLPGIALALVYASRVALHGLPLTTVVLLLAAMGYFAPNVLLSRRISARQAGIFEAFPDALDLMTICVEAGLGLDAAIARVAKQIGMESSVLADEMHLVELELRAGSSRDRALRNLAVRTGVEEIEALVAMLVQADRFGTS